MDDSLRSVSSDALNLRKRKRGVSEMLPCFSGRNSSTNSDSSGFHEESECASPSFTSTPLKKNFVEESASVQTNPHRHDKRKSFLRFLKLFFLLCILVLCPFLFSMMKCEKSSLTLSFEENCLEYSDPKFRTFPKEDNFEDLGYPDNPTFLRTGVSRINFDYPDDPSFRRMIDSRPHSSVNMKEVDDPEDPTFRLPLPNSDYSDEPSFRGQVSDYPDDPSFRNGLVDGSSARFGVGYGFSNDELENILDHPDYPTFRRGSLKNLDYSDVPSFRLRNEQNSPLKLKKPFIEDPDDPTFRRNIDAFEGMDYPDDPSFRSTFDSKNMLTNFDYPDDDPDFRRMRDQRLRSNLLNNLNSDYPDDPKFRGQHVEAETIDYSDDPQFLRPLVRELREASSDLSLLHDAKISFKSAGSFQNDRLSSKKHVREKRGTSESNLIKQSLDVKQIKKPHKKRFKNPRKRYGFRRRKNTLRGTNFHLRF